MSAEFVGDGERCGHDTQGGRGADHGDKPSITGVKGETRRPGNIVGIVGGNVEIKIASPHGCGSATAAEQRHSSITQRTPGKADL